MNSPADLGTVPSRRTTTSSRRPGVAIQGTVHVARGELVTCLDCGTRWWGGLHHAPHFNAQGVLVDCIGREVGT